jgi:hypothetical protein
MLAAAKAAFSKSILGSKLFAEAKTFSGAVGLEK